MLGFAIETGCEALLPGTAFLARFSFFVVGSGGAKMELPLFGTQLRSQSRCGTCRIRLPLNVATGQTGIVSDDQANSSQRRKL
jgi:hypothetical protein